MEILPFLLKLILVSCMASQGTITAAPRGTGLNKTLLRVDFPANIRSAFDETGDAGFLPVTGISKPENRGAVAGPVAATTPSRVLILRAKRDAGEVLDIGDEGSGEELGLEVTVGATLPTSVAASSTTTVLAASSSTSSPTTTPTSTPKTTRTTTAKEPSSYTHGDTSEVQVTSASAAERGPDAATTISVEEDQTPHNGTLPSGLDRSSVRYAIIMGAIILFWILLAPIVCLFCRYRDNQKQKSEKQRQHLAHDALLEYHNQDLTRAPGDAKKPAHQSNGSLPPHSQNPGTPRMNGSAPHHHTLPDTPVANGKVAPISPPCYSPLPADIQFIDDDDNVWVQAAPHDAYDIVHLKDSSV